VPRTTTRSWRISRASFTHLFVSSLPDIGHQHALTFLPAEEDCALRSLVKAKIQDPNDELSGPEDSVEKGGEEDGRETGNAPKSAKQCEYLEKKEKNIAYLKK